MARRPNRQALATWLVAELGFTREEPTLFTKGPLVLAIFGDSEVWIDDARRAGGGRTWQAVFEPGTPDAVVFAAVKAASDLIAKEATTDER